MCSAGSCCSSELGVRRRRTVGRLSDAPAYRHRRRPVRGADADIVARLVPLPIANGAVDAVLLPHTLEFETDPYAVVREADRVLTGEGQLIVLGFRPFSLWGFRSRAIARGYPPGLRPHARRAAGSRLARAARLRRRADAATICSRRPGAARRRDRRSRPRCCAAAAQSLPAGAYLLQGAQARLHADAAAAEDLRERTQVIGGLVKPTTPRARLLSEGRSSRSTPTAPAAAIPGPADGVRCCSSAARTRALRRRSRRPPTTAWSSRPRSRRSRAASGRCRCRSTRIRSTCARASSSGCPTGKLRGWKTADRKPVKNQDLWQALDALRRHTSSNGIWVKGHSGQRGQRARRRARQPAIDAMLGGL